MSRYFISRQALTPPMNIAAEPQSIPLIAYHKGRTAQVSWDGSRGLQMTLDPRDSRLDLALDQLKEGTEAVLLDGRGILRNMPDPASLANAPEECRLWLDSGVRRGEDVIDVVMADVADPIVTARHLTGPDQLEVAADYCERLMLALDWSGEWVANPSWKALGWEGLGATLREWSVDHLLVQCHDPNQLPHRPPTTWEDLELYILLFGEMRNPWPEATAVRPLQLTGQGGP